MGGGNAKHIEQKLPAYVKLVPNVAGLLGGIALWHDLPSHEPRGSAPRSAYIGPKKWPKCEKFHQKVTDGSPVPEGAIASNISGWFEPSQWSSCWCSVHLGRAPLVTCTAKSRRHRPTRGTMRETTDSEISELTPPLLLAEAERGRPFGALAPLHVHNVNTLKANDLRLYDEMGRIDEGAACALDELLGDARDRSNIRTTTIDRRTLQLMFRAAYHFRATRVELISGYREPGARREGQHGFGKANRFSSPQSLGVGASG